jgi:hypothetical protein
VAVPLIVGGAVLTGATALVARAKPMLPASVSNVTIVSAAKPLCAIFISFVLLGSSETLSGASVEVRPS